MRAAGIDPDRPIVVFVGRITRQKGVGHLVAAAHDISPDAQLVLCAGAPDTPEIAAETEAAVAELPATRPGVFWIRRMLETAEVRQLLSAATVFVCPSVYEPLGIVNLEAMACGTAVVACDVGGIPEVVEDGSTGLLVPYDEHEVAGVPSRSRRGRQRGARRSRARRRDGPGGAGARGARVLLGPGGRADRGDLPRAALRWGSPAGGASTVSVSTVSRGRARGALGGRPGSVSRPRP